MSVKSQEPKDPRQTSATQGRRKSLAADKQGIQRPQVQSAVSGKTTLFDLFNEISIIEHLARNKFERALPNGFTVSQFSVLNHLVRVGDGVLPVRIARAFQVAKGAMTNTIHRLEERGFVIVTADEHDRRAKRVFLTSAGREMRESCIQIANQVVLELSQTALAQELLAIVPVLAELRKYLDSERERN
ncbi:MAG: MarR family transcriptional regulator [Beijerinckiaceae bacterium]|nr:MarR family transcriptional regulator [Brevundimonas sp.]MCZ8302037.1 MarR family transcriptional regulator [Beijerinckiaceae bacterium]